MNETIKDLINKVGTDTSGKWFSVDKIEDLTKLILDECCAVMSNETIMHDGYGYGQGMLHKKIKEHFGVKE